MEPLTAPSLDEIHQIVDRRAQRRRQAFRVTQVGVVGVMVGALFLGARSRPDGSIEEAEPADTDPPASGTNPSIDSEVVPLDPDRAEAESGEPDAVAPTATQAARLFNLGAFWGAGYDDEQVVVLAEEWNLPELDAKAQAGELIVIGRRNELEDVLGEPDGPFPGEFEADRLSVDVDLDYLAGAFAGAGYSLSQAEALATEWNLPQYEAKAAAGRLVLLGLGGEVSGLVGEPRRADQD